MQGSRTQRNDMTQQPNVHATPGAEISSGNIRTFIFLKGQGLRGKVAFNFTRYQNPLVDTFISLNTLFYSLCKKQVSLLKENHLSNNFKKSLETKRK